jgi:hypothetical protein
MTQPWLADLHAGRWQEALAMIEALPPAALDLAARMQRAKCLAGLGRIPEAQEAIAALRRAHPANPWAARLEADIAWAAGDRATQAAALAALRAWPGLADQPELGWALATGEARRAGLAAARAVVAELGLPADTRRLFLLLHQAGELPLLAAPERARGGAAGADPNAAPGPTSGPVSGATRRPSAIPRRIVQFWDRDPVPPGIRAQMDRWRALPGFAYDRFSAAQALAAIRATGAARVAQAFAQAGHPAQQSDIFRLHHLYHHGGLYLDADEAPSGDLGALLDSAGADHLFWLRDDRLAVQADLYCTNWFLAARPGSDLIGAALERAVGNTLARPQDRDIQALTGPYALTAALLEAHLAGRAGSVAYLPARLGRACVCRNVKASSDEYRAGAWQDYAGLTAPVPPAAALPPPAAFPPPATLSPAAAPPPTPVPPADFPAAATRASFAARLRGRVGRLLFPPPAPDPRALVPPARAALDQGRARLEAGDRAGALACYARATELDGRALCRPWGLLPHLEAEGRANLRARFDDRLARWYGPLAHLAPPVAHLAQKRRLRAWAAEHGFATPRLLAAAPSLDALDWAALPADRLVIKPDNQAARRGVVAVAGGIDHMARAPVGPDLAAYVRAVWAKDGISGAAVLVEEMVRDAEDRRDPELILARDWKAYAVAGRVAFLTVLDRNAEGGRRGRQSYDRQGHHTPPTKANWDESPERLPVPPGYAALIAEAERLSRFFPHLLRLDFYLAPEGPLLGEITTYPAAGMGHSPFARRTLLQMWEICPD